jgi:prepilin-type N-terminal cleavage/methylation domain-containing protein/prepilin-type processing-associated H-X9-DG protein
MKTSLSINRTRGLTLVEVLTVVVVLAFFAAVYLSKTDRDVKRRAQRVVCLNNLKQVGLAFRVSMGGCSDRYNTQTSTNQGGSLEFASGPNAFRHFQVMSNELGTTRLLFCPADSGRSQMWSTNFDSLSNSNVSYFVGVDAVETDPAGLLSGDRHLTNGTPVKNGLLEFSTDPNAGWTAEMHNREGNLLFADGSAHKVTTAGLRVAITNQSVTTNRLQMPVLIP